MHDCILRNVSRRTFFHYFASKEDVVLSRHDDVECTLVDATAGATPSGGRTPASRSSTR